jgi:DNA-directed RNA polymerase subunit RPC12/RpoP
MQSVASLEIDAARVLLERLRLEGIVADLRTTIEESGLEISQVMVEDEQYERACDLAEAWQTELTEQAEKRSGRRCPKCGSWHLRYAPRDSVGDIWECRDCGCEIAFKNRV